MHETARAPDGSGTIAGLARAWDIADGNGPSTIALAPGRPPDLTRSVGPGNPEGGASALSFELDGELGPARPDPPRFPQPGEILASFRIVSELGRGAFARVYLAEQPELGDRLVALKVAPSLGDEPQNLARLQHAHIVPIHSVHDDPASGLRLFCMPYVGGANLAEVLRAAGASVASEATGRSLVEALDRLGQPPRESIGAGAPAPESALGGAATGGLPSPSLARSVWGRYLARMPWWSALPRGASGRAAEAPDDPERDNPARRYLRSVTYVEACAWIAARLAEALEHAHDRGILHRDLKPSNVLIAADGMPMLLDFNLSADLRPAAGRAPTIGGTIPYMAPEQLDAFNPRGRTPPEAVGPAADTYALGLILFEMVAGRHPFPDPPRGRPLPEALHLMAEQRRAGAPSARRINGVVPWGLESILGKCLEPDPRRRYARAGDLADDLRRLLDDRPLKHAPELSARERLEKWARRHPWATSSTTIGAAAAGLVVACGVAVASLASRLESSHARLQFDAFRRGFRESQVQLSTAGTDADRAAGIARAGRLIDAYGVARRDDWWRSPAVARLDPEHQAALREAMSELVQLRTGAAVRAAEASPDPGTRARALQEAIAWLGRAERFDPRPSYALYSDRARYAAALGRAAEADADRRRAEARPPAVARDFDAIGTAWLASGQPDRAERALTRAAALDPRRYWSWFALGLCHHRQGRFAEAAADFAVCSALEPRQPWPHINRGLALAAAGRLAEARASYDRAVALDGRSVAARINRALARLELGDPAAALADLDEAIRLGHTDPATLAARAEALARLGRRAEALRDFDRLLAARPGDVPLLVARGTARLASDPDGARADFRDALARDPANPRVHVGLAHLLRRDDPHAALRHLDAALDAEADSADALILRALTRARLGDPAAEADVDRLERTPTPHRLYNAACAEALLFRAARQPRQADRAAGLLARALAAGFPASQARDDPDLADLRARPEVRTLLSGPLRASAAWPP